MYSSMLLAEKEVNTLFFHFHPLIAFVNDLDTNDIPWNEKGRLKWSSALPRWVTYGPGCDFEVLTVFLFVKRKRFEFLLGAYPTFVIFYIFVRILVENHEADFFFPPEKLSVLSRNINDYLWLSQKSILENLLAFIFLVEVEKGFRRMIFFSIYKF